MEDKLLKILRENKDKIELFCYVMTYFDSKLKIRFTEGSETIENIVPKTFLGFKVCNKVISETNKFGLLCVSFKNTYQTFKVDFKIYEDFLIEMKEFKASEKKKLENLNKKELENLISNLCNEKK